MNDVLREYTGVRSGMTRRRRKSGFRLARRILAALVLVVFVWAVYVTRDTYRMGALIPADQFYQIYTTELLEKRAQLGESLVWELAPEESVFQRLPALAAGDFGMPEWVLNNLVFGGVHISGQDLEQFSDVLFIARMSRIGCLIERGHPFAEEVQRDHAGGLELRYVPATGIYYAVRGRLLVASPSRQALVRSLTLTSEAALGQERLTESFRGTEGEGLSVLLQPPARTRLGALLSTAKLSLVVAPEAAGLDCRVALQPQWQERAAALFANAAPQRLAYSPDGILSSSGCFGVSLPEAWLEVRELLATAGVTADLDDAAAYMRGFGGSEEVLPLFREVMERCGTMWRINWHGIDLNSVIPLPEVAAQFDGAPQLIQQAILSAEAMAGGDMLVRADTERGVLGITMLGGAEPTAAVSQGGILLSTSRPLAEQLLSAPPSLETTAIPANLYVQVRPKEVVNALAAAGSLLAESGFLRGYNQASFSAASAKWQAEVERMELVSVTAAYEGGELMLRARVEMGFPSSSGAESGSS